MLKSFGNDLKMLRESKGITIAEIAAQTRINPKFINYLESGIFDFQPETYIRAFLKAYAKSLELNENQILTEYDKAKAGFYQPKHLLKEKTLDLKKISESYEDVSDQKESKQLSSSTEIPKAESYSKPAFRGTTASKGEFSHKGWLSKVLLGILLLLVVLAVIYLIDYLNTSSEDRNTSVKPKSFSDLSTDYENKIKGKLPDTTQQKEDTAAVKNDSLKLLIVVAKETRIKVHIDEKRLVDEVLQPKDSITIYAKEQFRFSANSNASVDLYLNGKYLRKPSTLTGSSIKNLVINKDGIVP